MRQSVSGAESSMDRISHYTCFVVLLFVSTHIRLATAEWERGDGRAVCSVRAPSSVRVDRNSWKFRREPELDELDVYITNTTGCRYASVVWFSGLERVTLSDTLRSRLEWHFALRAKETAYIDLKWNNDYHFYYRFGLGYNSSKVTYLERVYPRPRDKQSLRVPGVLSPTSFHWFYVKLDNETLSMGKECDKSPLFVHNVSVPRDTDVELTLGSESEYGVKVLSYCPTKSQAPCLVPSTRGVEYRCLSTPRAVEAVYRACRTYEEAGSVLSPLCDTNYYSPTDLTTMHCIDGEWTNKPKCIPECGTLTPTCTALLIGGQPVSVGEVPWHAGVYTTTTSPYMQVCGGTLIVVSAAHCFWSELLGALPASQFAVGLGKLYRPWNNKKDHAQRSDVQTIHLAAGYHGSDTNYQHDLAVLVLLDNIQFLAHIRPVCIDFDVDFEKEQLTPGKLGKVAGWGLTSADGAQSRSLRVLSLPAVSFEECYSSSPQTFRPHLTTDKLCAGLNNGSTALCRGDSGGGLAFPAEVSGTTRYFLRGVASTAPPSHRHRCNAHSYTSFTRISTHKDFLSNFLE